MEKARQYPAMNAHQRPAVRVAMLLLGGALLFASGFVVGRSENTAPLTAPAIKPSVREAAKHAPEPALPDARLAMSKAVLLREQNPDAYKATYLNKQYRVTGKVETVVGTVHRDLYSGPSFGVILESWNLRGSQYPMMSEPHLELIDMARRAEFAVRPRQQTDATCLLEDWMDFRYCRLNQPIGP